MDRAVADAIAGGGTIVTANKRLARTLQHLHNRQQAAAGLQAWRTPDILSWAAWLQRLWHEARLRGGAGTERALLGDSAAAFLWQLAVRADADPRGSSRQTAQLARQARRTWARLQEWQGLAADEWTRPDLSPDQRAWLRWSGRYRDHCRDRGWTDQESLPALLTAVVAAGRLDDTGPLLFAGFDDWPPARQTLLDALAARGIGIAMTTPGPAADSVTLAAQPSAAAEALAAAAWARARLAADPAARVGVIVPDLASRAPAVRRACLDVLAPRWRLDGVPADLPLNVSYGQPLAGVPAVATALGVLRLLEGRARFDDLSLLLRSPWLAGAREEAAARAALDIRLREQLRVEFGLAAAVPLCSRRAPVFAGILATLAEAARARARQGSAAWAHAFTDLLQACGWPGSDSLDSERWQMVQAWHELLRDFADSGSLLGDLTGPAAVTVLAQLAQQALFQPEGVDHGVQVMGVLEAAGQQFDAMWLCGMARELWPPAARPDPFIPLELQRRLGMPEASAEAALAQAANLAQRLQASAAAVVVSWPAQADGEALSPSRLFSATGAPQSLPAPVTWNEQARAAGATELLAHDPPPPWRGGMRVPGGASVLSRQAVSPLNAFIQNRLGAFEMQRPAVAVSAMARGNLTHAALEAFYTATPASRTAAALSADARAAVLHAALERALAVLPGIREPFMQRVAAFETTLQLERLLAFLELDLAREPFTVEACEAKHDIGLGPLQLRLRLDRLDRDAQGRRFVIDYKTGRINRQSWNPDKPRDLQLPLYVDRVAPDAAAVAFAQIAGTAIGYDGVGDGSIPLEGLRTPGKRQKVEVRFQYPHTDNVIESWDELRRVWSDLLQQLAGAFAAGDYRFDPRNPDSARGQFAVLSRIYDAGLCLAEESE